MRQSIIAVVLSSIVIAGLSIVLVHWPSHDRRDQESALEPQPVEHDQLRAEPAHKQRFPLPLQPSGPAGPATVAPNPAVVDLVREHPSASAEEVLWGYQTDVCACYTTACLMDLADRHTALLMSMRDFDPGEAEQKALIEGIKKCIEVVRAREQPVDLRTPAELAAQRDEERREIMLRETGSAEDERSQ
jgi:hypothetical protein